MAGRRQSRRPRGGELFKPKISNVLRHANSAAKRGIHNRPHRVRRTRVSDPVASAVITWSVFPKRGSCFRFHLSDQSAGLLQLQRDAQPQGSCLHDLLLRAGSLSLGSGSPFQRTELPALGLCFPGRNAPLCQQGRASRENVSNRPLKCPIDEGCTKKGGHYREQHV